MPQRYTEYAKFYHQHGVRIADFNPHESEVVADCPFCGKEEHLYFDNLTSKFDCKVCYESGNDSTFLKLLVEYGIDCTTDAHLNMLANKKGFDEIETFKQHEICRHPFKKGLWMLPIHNENGGYSNIYLFSPRTNKLISSPKKSQCLYRGHTCQRLTKKPKDDIIQIVICEGHWDTLMAYKVFYDSIEDGLMEVVGTPGATTFKQMWLPLLKHKSIVMLYDNDNAGEKGMIRLQGLLKREKIPYHILTKISWGEGFPEGFDFRDLCLRNQLHAE